MPSRLTSSCVGASPTASAFFVGCRIEPPVSSAIAQVTRFAATDEPDPLLEVPADRSVSYGLQLTPPNGTAREAGADVGLRDDDRAGLAHALDEGGVTRRAVVGVRDVGAGGRAHVERVVPVLDRVHRAVQRADELAGGFEVRVLLRGDFERVRHVGVVVERIRHAPRLVSRRGRAPCRLSGPQVHRDHRVDLAGVLDRRERPEQAVGHG